MEDIDMSAPGSELFPEANQNNYNSYSDVNPDQFVGDPLNMGVTEQNVASPAPSDKEFNFRALREETAKLKEEREYWKGQAEALHKVPSLQPEKQPDVYENLDWQDSTDVKRAFDTLRTENQNLRHEMKDAFTALNTKSSRPDWSNMVTQHVPELTSKNPIFAEMINNASNPYEAAYLLAELKAGSLRAPVPMSQDAQRAIANSQKPQSLASVGGRGSLSQTDHYASMSDKDFMEIAARNMASI